MTTSSQVPEIVERQAARWRNSPYYDAAEGAMVRQWTNLVEPIIKNSDFTTVVDLAAGHGRNSQFLLPLCKTLYIVDIHAENVDFCRHRFGDDPRIRYIKNNGLDLDGIASESVTLVYCFDAMVHFHSDVVRSYLKEFHRILVPGGTAFCHHSNSTNDPGGLRLDRHVQGRNFMTKDMFGHYCVLEGFEIIHAREIDWGGSPKLDCVTYFKKPDSKDAG